LYFVQFGVYGTVTAYCVNKKVVVVSLCVFFAASQGAGAADLLHAASCKEDGWVHVYITQYVAVQFGFQVSWLVSIIVLERGG
jgi:hypothetical protein